MKSSYLNPEVHSLTFRNFAHTVCGVSGCFQCGGMCCMVLSKFYKGELIDCESVRKSFENGIWNRQLGIIGSDIYKSCRWGKSMDAVDKISDNIDVGKPTLLYLDLKDWSLVDDHFVVAYAMDDISSNVKQIYIYDPNYVYKRHFCNDPTKTYCIDPDYPNSTLKNKESYLELNYTDETVILVNGSSSEPVLGFKWYGQDETGIPVSHYTDERAVQHSCDITLISTNPPELINGKPVISHNIKISKTGNVPADLKLWWEGDHQLYESDDNLFPVALKDDFGSSVKHVGLQCGNGYVDKTYRVYQNYAPSNPATIVLRSNFLEKSLQLMYDTPEIETFTAFAEGTTPQLKHYYPAMVDNQIMKIQGLDREHVEEVEKVPDAYGDALPVNRVSFQFIGDDWQSAINDGTYSLVDPVFYLGYIKSNVVVEITHNGLYVKAKTKMTSDDPSSVEKEFTDDVVTFTLPGGNKTLYDSNARKTLNFEIKGEEISAAFSDSFSTILQYRCLIIHEPLLQQPHFIDFDVFARYFEKLLINIPHSYRIPELEIKFNQELAKHPGMDPEKFKVIFCEQLIDRFVKRAKTFWNYRRISRNFIQSFHSCDNFRTERMISIFDKSRNFQEIKQNFDMLENQMRPLIGGALVAKGPFRRVITRVLKREWK